VTLVDVEQLLRIVSYVATPVIAIAALRIAHQQARINQQKLKIDSYERRMQIYGEVKEVIRIVTRDAGISSQDLNKFKIAVAEADFLFGPDVCRYLEEISSRGFNLWKWRSQYRDIYAEGPPPAGYDHEKLVSEMHKETMWLVSQMEPAKQHFKKYMDIAA
jgi:hypothetical protein